MLQISSRGMFFFHGFRSCSVRSYHIAGSMAIKVNISGFYKPIHLVDTQQFTAAHLGSEVLSPCVASLYSRFVWLWSLVRHGQCCLQDSIY